MRVGKFIHELYDADLLDGGHKLSIDEIDSLKIVLSTGPDKCDNVTLGASYIKKGTLYIDLDFKSLKIGRK